MNLGASAHRVNRGGGWNNDAARCRSAGRDSYTPSLTFDNLGFRVSLAPPVQ